MQHEKGTKDSITQGTQRRLAHLLGGQNNKIQNKKMDKGNDQAVHSKANAKMCKSKVDIANCDS